jgi:uncharacterized YccA/Bax inhibitor family protein
MPPLMTDSSPRIERAFRDFPRETDLAPGRLYTAAGVYDKVAVLAVLALATGVYNYVANNSALILVGIFGGLVFYFTGIFKPALAKYTAPLYALAEGLALGGITKFYATGNTGIIPAAILFTGGIFLASLVVFRSGLVKVTQRFVTMAMIAAGGFFVVLLGSLFGLYNLNSAGGNLVIGLIGVVIGVMFLFVDFSIIQRSEQAQLPVEAEWVGALLLMASLVMVYINVLRILGRRR